MLDLIYFSLSSIVRTVRLHMHHIKTLDYTVHIIHLMKRRTTSKTTIILEQLVPTDMPLCAGKTTLPLLDIKNYYTNPTEFVEQLRAACHKVGFFLLKHDIPIDLAQRQLEETRKFFQFPLEKKLKISYHDSPSFRGYMKLGVENTAGAVDLREQIEYAVEYENAIKDTNTREAWPPYQRLKSDRNPWPSCYQPSLQTTTQEYVRHLCRTADCIREILCLALGLEKSALDPLFARTKADDVEISPDTDEQPHWVLKLVRYPVIDERYNCEKKAFGVGAHTDTNFLTLVLQDDIGGLQIFAEEEWIDVPKDLGPGILVCNLGEQAEILSRGYFLATPHRVLANTSGEHSRISVPFFYNPSLSATIEALVGKEHKKVLNWERRGSQKYWVRPNNKMLATVGDNTFKSLARSHPEVFEKHHSDLELLEDGQITRKKFQCQQASHSSNTGAHQPQPAHGPQSSPS